MCVNASFLLRYLSSLGHVNVAIVFMFYFHQNWEVFDAKILLKVLF